MATRISCKTCHKHSSFEFSGDTAIFSLRTVSPVLLNYFQNQKAVDYGSIGNLCVTCHQIRGAGNAYTKMSFFPFDLTKPATDAIEYRQGTSFSVHDGNQSNLFKGENGYEYPGKTYTRTWQHSTNSCTDCHMNDYNATTKTGGHSLKPNEEKCTACHGGDKITPIQTEITTLIAQLGDLLYQRKVFKRSGTAAPYSYSAVNTHDYNGLLYDGTTTTDFVKIEANTTVSATTGLVVYGTKLTTYKETATDAATRIKRTWKYGELGAAYNYGYINSELSKGVHNYGYAKQILQNSIEWLQANP